MPEEQMKTLYIDSHEADEARVETISTYFTGKGYEVETQELKAGDYAYGEDGVISDIVGVEFKSLNDFFLSLPKIKSQCIELAQTYKISVLMIEGSLADIVDDKGGYHINQIFGMLGRIKSLGVGTIYTGHYYLNEMFWLFEKCVDEKNVIEEYEPFRPQPTVDDYKELNIRSLPSISKVLTGRILDKYTNLREFYNTSLKRLMGVEGIGQKKAERIMEVILE